MAPRGDGGSGIRFGDRGATATEYLGMLVVVVAVLAAVSVTGAGQAVGDRIGCAVAGIGGGGCGADAPFGRLMFDEGVSGRMSYDGETDAAAYGFEVNLGMGLGFSVSTEQKEETLSDARFLGAPRDGRREYVPYSYCAS